MAYNPFLPLQAASVAASNTNADFITDQITCPVAIVDPDKGVTKAKMPPYFSHAGALAQMMQPQHCPVPTSVVITSNERRRLSEGCREFFRGVLRPTVKHV